MIIDIILKFFIAMPNSQNDEEEEKEEEDSTDRHRSAAKVASEKQHDVGDGTDARLQQ